MKKKIILAVASIAIIMLDQISKLIMIDKNINIIPQILSFSYTQNTGVAFGLISNNIIFVIIFNIVILGIIIKFLKENMNVKILSFKGNVFSVEPPMFVELEVTYTEPGFAGNTTTTSGKPATLENGYKLTVPLFVNIGDVVRIDTRTGEYMERV